MLAHRPFTSSAGLTGAIRHTCPLCHGRVVRVWRRPFDRFVSWLVPLQRFHCEDFSCQWEGNFRTPEGSDGQVTRRSGLHAGYSHPRLEAGSFIWPGLIIGAASVLIAVAALAEW